MVLPAGWLWEQDCKSDDLFSCGFKNYQGVSKAKGRCL